MNKYFPYHIMLLVIGFIAIINYIHTDTEVLIEPISELRMVDSLITITTIEPIMIFPSIFVDGDPSIVPIENDTVEVRYLHSPIPSFIERLDTVYITVPKTEMIYIEIPVEKSFIGSLESIIVIIGAMFNLLLGIFQLKEKRKKDLES